MNAHRVFMHTFTYLSLILPSPLPPCFVSSPFRFIPVMKRDGQYVLLTEEQYNTLKGEGKIVGRDFVVDYQVGRLPSASSPPPLPTVVLVPQAQSTSSVFGRRIYLSSQRATLSSLFLGGGGRAPCLPPANSPFSFHTHASLVFVLSYALSLSSSGRSCLTPPLSSPLLPSLFPLARFAPGGECSCCCGSTGHRGRRQESDLHR
jgi:hypothetical protein